MAERKESNLTLIGLALFYVGLYMFLYGLIKARATKVATRIVGWVSTWMILILGTMLIYDRSSEPKATVRVDSVVVKVKKANVRSAPARGKNVIGKAMRGEMFSYHWRDRGWYAVSFGDGTAYVHRSVVDKKYVTVPGRFRWPALPSAFFLFCGTYVIALVSAFREERRFYRELADA